LDPRFRVRIYCGAYRSGVAQDQEKEKMSPFRHSD
jgi:hypothetical protein